MARRNLKFWDFIAKRYARQPVPDEAQYRHKLEKTRELLSARSEVLEFGCGTGTTALYHAPFAKHILAIDVSAKMLAIAEDKKQAQGANNVTFRQSTIEALEVAEGFDVVMAHSILHLLEDKEAVLDKVFDLLKPGGYLVSSTLCPGRGAGWLRGLLSLGRIIGLLPLVNFFSPEHLRECMERAGFVIEYQWQPDRRSALFLVARKPLGSSSG